MWATMATQHPLLPKPLQPRLSTFPPLDPSSDLETPRPPQRVPASTHWPGPASGNFFQTLGPGPEMINKLRSPLRQRLSLATNLTLIQHNSLGSWDVFLSLFSSLVEGLPPDIVLLQDPPSSKRFLPSFSYFKSFAPPVARPRVACFVSRNILPNFAVLPFFPPETDDFMALYVFTPRGYFGTNFRCFTIGSIYARPLPSSPHSVSPESSLLNLEPRYLVASDFNIHNAGTDPSRLLSLKEEKESASYFDQASDLGFTPLNVPGVHTRFPSSGTHRPSTIDLAFANRPMCPGFRSRDTSSLPSTPSDHARILIAIRPTTPYNDRPRPRCQEANWVDLAEKLNNWLVARPHDTPSPSQLDQSFFSALSALMTTI